MKITPYLFKALILLILVAPGIVYAQNSPTTLILPDGSVLKPGKLDSLEKAWGNGRIMMRHDEEDDKNHVMHLIRKTDEMEKKMEEASKRQHQVMNNMIGQPAPLWAAKDINGKTWTLAALKGKVVVLNFWFTSCPPCIAEIPHLNELVDKYGSSNVVFIALAYNDEQKISAFLKDHRFKYQLIPNSTAIDKLYAIGSWPTSYVIDTKGIVRYAGVYDDHISELLSQAIESVQ